MLTLFGTRGSGSAAIEAALEIAGLTYETFDAVPWQPSPALDALRAVNPLLQIPALQLEDGSVLTESAAILIHLGLQHPESGLLASEPAQRAQQLRGLVYIAANCYAAIGTLDYPDRWYPEPDEATRKLMDQRGRSRLHELWRTFGDQFPAYPWLSGEQPGALDLFAGVVSRWGGARQHLAESQPAFAAVLSRIDALAGRVGRVGSALAGTLTRAAWVVGADPKPTDKPRLCDRAAQLVVDLALAPHPEGGYFREIFRSVDTVTPSAGRPKRRALTSIDFLLASGQCSAWHRVRSDEAWHLLEGGPLRLWLMPPTLDVLQAVTLGAVDGTGAAPRHVVPAHWWQAAEPLGDYAYAGATVGPGFDFADFSFLRADASACARLAALAPDLQRLL